MQETPRVSWWQRLMQTSTAAKVGIIAGVVVFSCGLCACVSFFALAAYGSTLPHASTARSPVVTPVIAHTLPTHVATPTSASATPTLAATVSPQSGVTVAALGGPVQAFYAKYGTEADNLFDVNGVTFSLNDDTGADGTPHAFEMLVYPSDASQWTLQQAKPVCTPFLPPDAVFSRSITTSDGNPEDVYTSVQAKASFASSSSWYTADGSINIDYEHPPAGGSGIWQCRLSLGV